MRPPTKSKLRELYKKNPESFWEIMTEDMIGRIPKSLQAPADDFLKTAGPKWESWLLWQSWKIQRRAATEPKHHDSFLGMLAIVGWLLHLVTKSPVRQPKEVKKVESLSDKLPESLEDVMAFTEGMKAKIK